MFASRRTVGHGDLGQDQSSSRAARLGIDVRLLDQHGAAPHGSLGAIRAHAERLARARQPRPGDRSHNALARRGVALRRLQRDLERAGLAERRNKPNDRRVKLVVLTPKGTKTKAELMEAFYATPPQLLELDNAELETLQRALERLVKT